MRRALVLVVLCLVATAGLAAAQEPLPVPVPAANLIIGKSAPVDAKGRFGLRVNFSESAPAGKKAKVTASRNGTKLGSVEVPVRRGESVQARLPLTKSATARVTRAGKLRATLRLVLGSETQTKTVTLKR